jgi:hypothetical protein
MAPTNQPGGLLVNPGKAEGDVDHSLGVSIYLTETSNIAYDISFVVITGLSALVAWSLSKVFKLKRSQT